ncbi:MAG: hypothetical protein EOO68_01480 [Moraxellaceae bacterium]|nr:MAG: hypothetical protein EOO68_01480 [Moraxellaceae bacterium]
MTADIFYIAGMGMVSPLGGTMAQTYAAIKANISGYASSDYFTRAFEPVTLAKIPDDFFTANDDHINCLTYANKLEVMALQAIRDACGQCSFDAVVPTLLALPDFAENTQPLLIGDFNNLAQAIVQQCAPWVDAKFFRSLSGGRVGGFEALDFAYKYLVEGAQDYILIGAADSHMHLQRLDDLENDNRLLSALNSDAFIPGEGACFILLTTRIEFAMQHQGCVVAVHRPGLADEQGHLNSDRPCLGQGLDTAFKMALQQYIQKSPATGKISALYSSINGERYWAKELGVARLRNQAAFINSAQLHHPADCVGDLGAATATELMALAAMDLLKSPESAAVMVTSSSDFSRRAAVVLERVALSGK